MAKILPKTKSYHRYQSHPRDRVVEISKYSKKDASIFSQISQWFDLQNRKMPEYYSLNSGTTYIMAYFSDYVTAANLSKDKALPCSSQIYDDNRKRLLLE